MKTEEAMLVAAQGPRAEIGKVQEALDTLFLRVRELETKRDALAEKVKAREEIEVNWHEDGGGLICPTGWGFVLYEVPQYGGEPRFVGHFSDIESAKKLAEKWT